MNDPTKLYGAFFQSQAAFLNPNCPMGYEADIVHDYLYHGKRLAHYYAPNTATENTLLCELFLRQVFFHLVDAIGDPARHCVFRQVCLDTIYLPLSQLQRFYSHFEHGMARYLALRRVLQSSPSP